MHKDHGASRPGRRFVLTVCTALAGGSCPHISQIPVTGAHTSYTSSMVRCFDCLPLSRCLDAGYSHSTSSLIIVIFLSLSTFNTITKLTILGYCHIQHSTFNGSLDTNSLGINEGGCIERSLVGGSMGGIIRDREWMCHFSFVLQEVWRENSVCTGEWKGAY